MKYSDQRELVEGLRELADFIEAHPELPISYVPNVKINPWLYDDSESYSSDWKRHRRTAREKLQIAARALGQAQKHFSSDYFDVTKKFGEFVELEFTVDRSVVCRRVVTGTKEIPEKTYPAHTEEIVEWICDDPILAS